MILAGIASRVAELRPTTVNQVLAEVRQLQKEGKQLASLMRGQPDLPTPAHIVEAARQALHEGRTGYPDNRGEPRLREAVAEKLAREQKLEYDPHREILVTDGATCGVSSALAALVNPGDEVLLPSPIYDAYNSPIALWGGRAVPVEASITDGRFSFDPAALEAARSPRTRVILLNTPWNPLGTVLNRDELEQIMDIAIQNDLWVISDEIYESLIYDGRQHLSPAAVFPEARGRTTVVNSLSKTYAMTGWRVGYCAAPKHVIDAMFLVLQQFSRGPATIVQDAAAGALVGDQACVREMVEEYQRRRDLVVRNMQGIPGVAPIVPGGGLFVMLSVAELGIPSDELRKSLLHEAGVVVVHGSAFGPGGEGTLRISFAGGGQQLEAGVHRLRDALRSLVTHTESTGRR